MSEVSGYLPLSFPLPVVLVCDHLLPKPTLNPLHRFVQSAGPTFLVLSSRPRRRLLGRLLLAWHQQMCRDERGRHQNVVPDLTSRLNLVLCRGLDLAVKRQLSVWQSPSSNLLFLIKHGLQFPTQISELVVTTSEIKSLIERDGLTMLSFEKGDDGVA